MPTTTTKLYTVVEFTKAEADALVSSHVAQLGPDGARFSNNAITIPVPKELQTASLRALIPGLPDTYIVSQVPAQPSRPGVPADPAAPVLRVSWFTDQ